LIIKDITKAKDNDDDKMIAYKACGSVA